LPTPHLEPDFPSDVKGRKIKKRPSAFIAEIPERK